MKPLALTGEAARNRLSCAACSKRKHKQQTDLLNRVNQETLRQGQAQDGDGGKSAGRRISEIVAYRSVDEVPATKDLKIEVRLGHLWHAPCCRFTTELVMHLPSS